ncbi:unnamed protein product [Ascophyllum nodosum]
MDCAVCRTRRATTKCNVFATVKSKTAKNRAQTLLPGLRFRSAPARRGRERGRRSRRVHQGRKLEAPRIANGRRFHNRSNWTYTRMTMRPTLRRETRAGTRRP